MNQYKYPILAVFVILIITNFFLILNRQSSFTDTESKIKSRILEVNSLIEHMDLAREVSFEDGRYGIDDAGKKVSLQSLGNSGNILILRLSWSHCEDCINSQIKLLERTLNSLQKRNVIVVTSFRSFRDMISAKKYYSSSLRFINVNLEDVRQSTAEKKNRPYFFLLGEDVSATKLFIPFGTATEISETYLKYLANKYLSHPVK